MRTGDDFGPDGFSVHGQIFRADGANPSARIGDIQTIDNIDAQTTGEKASSDRIVKL